jgi:ribokinase
MTAGAQIAVVGSLNMDLVVEVARLPGAGETVLGGDVFRNPGGKGANQAVAVARLGGRAAMVGCVGDDEGGRQLREGLLAGGVDASHVRIVPGVPSGTALIAVAPDGENLIVVSPGANSRLSTVDVEAATELLSSAAVTLLQLEVPMETVEAAARSAEGLVVLNPAPAGRLSLALLERVDILVPNRVELARLTGSDAAPSMDEISTQVSRLPSRAVVVTLGAEGALVVEDGRATHVPAVAVTAVDTTGAGDAFCAGLADALVRGDSLPAAARWAARVAAAACTRRGAQEALPTRKEALAL